MAEDVRVPERWRRVSLGEIAEINMGQSPPSTVVNERGIGIPFLQGNAEFTTKYPIPQKWTIKPIKLAKKGDILISVRAPVGAVNKADRDYCIGRGLAAISFKTISDRFGWFGLIYWKHQLENLSQGSTFEAISKEDLKNLLLLVPTSLQEQRKIAEILETIDNAIEKTDKIIEKYKRIKQGLMQDLLTKGIDENGQIRSEKTHRFKDSPLGRIPEEWEVVRLEEITNQIIDGTHHTPNYVKDGIPFLRVTDIQKNDINLDNVMKIDPQEHKTLSKRCKPEYGDILYSKNGTIGISKVVEWTWEFSIFVSLCLIKPKHEIVHNKFLKYFLDTEFIRKQIMYRAKQLSITNLHLEEIREFLVLLPPLPEQKRIASILSQIDKAIEKEQKYKEKLERIKRGLMEDLLTGKVRVNHLIE